MLIHRSNTIFRLAADGDIGIQGGTVTAYAPGGIVKTSSNGPTIELYGGHGFVGGEKFMRGIDIATYSGVVTVLSVAGNILTVDGNYAVDAGDRLVNLGADTGIANGPNFDQSSVTIYSTPDPTNVVDQSRVELNETGFYEYWHTGLALWEVIRGGDGAPIAIDIGASETAAQSFAFGVNVKTYGATGDGVTDDTVAIQAALDSFTDTLAAATGGSGGSLLFPTGVYMISSALRIGSGVNIIGEGALASVIKADPSFSGSEMLLFQKLAGKYANDGIGMRNIRVEVNNVNTTGVRVYKGYDAVTFDTVYVDHVGTDGSAFYFEPDPVDGPSNTISQTIQMTNCYGIHGPSGSTGPVFYFKHCQEMTLVNCKGFGGYLVSPANCDVWVFDGCRGVTVVGGAVALSQTNGIHLLSTERYSRGLAFYGVTIEGCTPAVYSEGNVSAVTVLTLDGIRREDAAGFTTGGFVLENTTFANIRGCIGFTLSVDANCNRVNYFTEALTNLVSNAGDGTKVYADNAGGPGNLYSNFGQGLAIFPDDATGPLVHFGHATETDYWRVFWSRSGVNHGDNDFGFQIRYTNEAAANKRVWIVEPGASTQRFYVSDIEMANVDSGGITSLGHIRGLKATQSFTGNDVIATGGRFLVDLTNTSGTNTLTVAAPTGVDGKLLILRCAALTAGTITIADGGNVDLNTALGSWVPTAGDTITFVGSGGVWYEIARSTN